MRPALRLRGAREGALLVAEQFRLDQRLGQGGAVDRQERPAGTRRRAVDEARQHFLAGAGLSRQQHGRVGRGHLGGFADRLPPGRRDAHHPPRRAMPEHRQLVGQRTHPLLERRRAFPHLRGARRLVGEILVRQRERHVRRHPDGHGRVPRREAALCPRHEVESAEDLPVAPQRHAQRPAQAGSHGRDLLHDRVGRHVVAQEVVPRHLEQVPRLLRAPGCDRGVGSRLRSSRRGRTAIPGRATSSASASASCGSTRLVIRDRCGNTSRMSSAPESRGSNSASASSRASRSASGGTARR